MADGRNIPKYERSVALEVTQQPDVAGSFNAMINQFKNFSSTVAGISSEVSKQAQMHQRDVLQHNISTTYSQFAEEALNNKDPQQGIAQYDKNVKEYNAGVVADSGYFNKDYTQSLTDYYGQVHRGPIFRNAMAANKRMAGGQFAEYDNRQTEDINQAISQSSPRIDEKSGMNLQYAPAIAQYKNQQVTRQQALANDTITPKNYVSGKKQAYDNLIQNIALKTMTEHLQAGKGKEFWKDWNDGTFAKQMQAGGLPLPSERVLEQTGQLLIHKQRQFSYQSSHDKTTIQTDFNKEVADIATGKTLDQSILDDYIFQFPSKAKEAQARVEGAALVYSTKKIALYSSPSEITKRIQELKPTDPDDPDYHQKYMNYQAATTAVLAQEKAIIADPVKYAQNDPTVQAQLQQQKIDSDVGVSHTNYAKTPYNLLPKNPTQTIRNWQAMKGIPLSQQSVMTNDQSKEMVSAFETSDDAGKIGLFSQLKELYPDGVDYRLAVKQLIKDGMPARYANLVNYDMSDPDAQKVIAAYGMDIGDQRKILPNDMTTGKNGVDSRILKIINGSAGFMQRSTSSKKVMQYFDSIRTLQTTDGGEFASSMQESMQHLAYYALTNRIASTPENAVEWASGRIVHGMQFGSVDGNQIRAPEAIPMNTIQEYSRHMERTALRDYDFATPTQYLNEGLAAGKNLERSAAEYKKFILSGHVATNDTMTGLVWATPNGAIPTNKDGQPFEFLYKDAMNWNGNSVLDTQDEITAAMTGKPVSIEKRLEGAQSVTDKVQGIVAPGSRQATKIAGEVLSSFIPAANASSISGAKAAADPGKARRENLLKSYEGLPGTNGKPALRAYDDETGKPPVSGVVKGTLTIGYGHIEGVKIGDTMTEAEAEEAYKKDRIPKERAVDAAIKVKLSKDQHEALVSFAFNEGEGALKNSTLVKRINAGASKAKIKEAFLMWDKVRVDGKLRKSKGLRNRRLKEIALYFGEE